MGCGQEGIQENPPPRGGGAAAAVTDPLPDESLKHKVRLALLLVSGELMMLVMGIVDISIGVHPLTTLVLRAYLSLQ